MALEDVLSHASSIVPETVFAKNGDGLKKDSKGGVADLVRHDTGDDQSEKGRGGRPSVVNDPRDGPRSSIGVRKNINSDDDHSGQDDEDGKRKWSSNPNGSPMR